MNLLPRVNSHPTIHPPQPMVAQIRTVLQRCQAAGGQVQMEMFEDSQRINQPAIGSSA